MGSNPAVYWMSVKLNIEKRKRIKEAKKRGTLECSTIVSLTILLVLFNN
jgi:hypothetical protein